MHPTPHIDADVARRVRARLATYYDEFGLGTVPEPSDPFPHFDQGRLQLVLDLRPPVVSFHFGLPEKHLVERVKAIGARVISSATSVAEARWLDQRGVDAVIAQGLEAGGHGTIDDIKAAETASFVLMCDPTTSIPAAR